MLIRLNSKQVIALLKRDPKQMFIKNYFPDYSAIFDDEWTERGNFSQKVTDNLIEKGLIVKAGLNEMEFDTGLTYYYRLAAT